MSYSCVSHTCILTLTIYPTHHQCLSRTHNTYTVQCVIIANSLLDTEMFRETFKNKTNVCYNNYYLIVLLWTHFTTAKLAHTNKTDIDILRIHAHCMYSM